MKKIFAILFGILVLCSCNDRIEILFDTPFCSVMLHESTVSEYTIDKDANNLLTVLDVTMSVSNHYFTDPISIEYDVICGSGIKEGVDFEIQKTTKSPLTFDQGTYSKPIRLLWYKNPSFDPNADNTVRIVLKKSSVPQMLMGYPGPDSLHSEFVFTKIIVD